MQPQSVRWPILGSMTSQLTTISWNSQTIYSSDVLFPLHPPPPKPSHARELNFGPFRVRFGVLGGVGVGSGWGRGGVGVGSGWGRGGVGVGSGWGRCGVGERGFCKGKEYH